MSASFPNIGRRPEGARRGLAVGVLALAGLFSSSSAAQNDPLVPAPDQRLEGPRMRVLELEKEFGTVTRGEVLEAVYRIENIGTEPLEILRVKPG